MEWSSELRNWLLTDSDPSVRHRVLRELLDRPEDDPEVVAARQEIGQHGWAAEILRLQLPAGQWLTPGTSAEELYRPKYAVTNWMLLVLAELGATRTDPRVARSAELFLERASDPADDGMGGNGSHLCFTGNSARMMLRLGYGSDPRVSRAIQWLVSAQKPDGGWHCFPSSTGTLGAWEALSAFAAVPAPARSREVAASIERGLEFFLESGLLQDKDEPYPPWRRLHYPVHYYYDALVGLDVVTALGVAGDPRLKPALDWLESKRNRAGQWNLDALHPDIEEDLDYWRRGVKSPFLPFGLEIPGQPSRWITATALTVLRRAGRI